MDKKSKKIISLMLSVIMLIGVLAVGFSAFAEGEEDTWNCDKDGHEFTEFVSLGEEGHRATCMHCGESFEFRHIMKGGWQHVEGGFTHYIGCQECDYKSVEENHIDEDIDPAFLDAYGNPTTDGLCDVCGAELDHRYQKTGSYPATCTETGWSTYTCLYCKDTYKDSFQPALGHKFSDDLGTDSEYAKVEWSEDHSYCKVSFKCMRDCGLIPLEYQVVKDSGFLNNTITSAVDTENPTCGTVYTAIFTIRDVTNEGWHVWLNSDGTYSFTVEDVVYNHTPGEPVAENIVEATCTEPGSYDSVIYCSECGEEISRVTVEVDITDHTPANPVVENLIPATCVSGGSYDSVVYCSECEAEISRESLAIEPTGIHVDDDEDNYCDVCGTHMKHDYFLSKSVSATCVEEGHDEYSCRGCEAKFIEKTNNKLGHQWDPSTEETDFVQFSYTTSGNPSCTAKYTCMRCGETALFPVYYGDTYSNFGYVELTNENVEASCEYGSGKEYTAHFKITDFYFDSDGEPGTLEYTHTFVVEDGETAALGHKYGEYVVTTDPTCTDMGVETATCSRCGATTTRDLASKGHEFGEYAEQTAATCTTAGSESAVCLVCGETDVREIPALGHDFTVFVSGTEATCTTPGNGTYKCSRCEETSSSKTVNALGHNFTVTKQPTCTEAGTEKCTRCDLEQQIPATGHNDTNNDGICEQCGELFDEGLYNSALFRDFRLSIKKPSKTDIPFGYTLVLVVETNRALPEGYSFAWSSSNNSAIEITTSQDGKTCYAKSVSSGSADIMVEVVDQYGRTATYQNGLLINDSVRVSTTETLFRRIIAFFLNLFGANMLIY